ncbi:hypothetical protein ACHAXT_000678 [Thalassiosira profunda]
MKADASKGLVGLLGAAPRDATPSRIRRRLAERIFGAYLLITGCFYFGLWLGHYAEYFTAMHHRGEMTLLAPDSFAKGFAASTPSSPSYDAAHPYYVNGKRRFLQEKLGNHSREEITNLIQRDAVETMPLAEKRRLDSGVGVETWVLPKPLEHPTRNHDSVIIEDNRGSVVMYVALGRYSRYVQSIDLVSGETKSVRGSEGEERDPAGYRLDDLNHVIAVLVDGIDGRDANGKKELWLPCGFHGDAVNYETSSKYVRIVDVETMTIRLGPKLPRAGGACVASALSIIRDEPPMICSFAGTNGRHNSGEFLPHTQCYDRVREKWWRPFGKLPYGLDHGNMAVVPPGACDATDPGKLLIFNYRTEPYGRPHREMLAFDLPQEGWSLDELRSMEAKGDKRGHWYLYAEPNGTEWVEQARDAAGMVSANNGRTLLNFGGVSYKNDCSKGNRKRSRCKEGGARHDFSQIRAFDVCTEHWSEVGDLGLPIFALQSSGSSTLNVAVTCGGDAPYRQFHRNSPLCFASRMGGAYAID